VDVVLADGDRVLCEIVRRGLARAGVRVHVARNGADVPAQVAAAAPHAVLLGRGVAGVDVDALGVPVVWLEEPLDLDALRRRIRGGSEDLRFAELRLDRERHGLVVGTRFSALTPTEYQLLELLLRRPGQVLTRAEIHRAVWGYEFGIGAGGLRVYVGYLRRKLERAGARPLIETVRGVGYVLREPRT
jgi:two-component system response regulator MprA